MHIEHFYKQEVRKMIKEISAEAFTGNVFDRIGKQWMLISAGDQDKVNAMTASWGGMGVLWNKNVVYIFVRPQRFTKTLLDTHEHFAISFYPEEMRKMLGYMGKATGANEDKIAHENLHVIQDLAPYFEEAQCTMICRKLYAQELDPEGFFDGNIDRLNYPDKDYHILYVGEVEKVLVKE